MNNNNRPESVLFGKDFEALNILLKLHATPDPFILDCTYNTGVMWKKTNFKPIRMDINTALDLDVAADFSCMPFANHIFDVILFDPPHLPTNAASVNSSKIWEKRYGITSNDKKRSGDNVSNIFPSFVSEAKRILKPGGIIIAKLADIIHNHRYQWQHVDFINVVREFDMTPCDMLIKRDPLGGRLKSNKWKNIKHLRKVHSYFIVVRNSKKCEP